MPHKIVGVVAVVVTHSRPAMLERLLAALESQTVEIKAVVVVDNGGLPETAEIVARHERCHLVNKGFNLGGAGGFAYGMLHALTLGADHLWIMDDDGCPADATTLGELLDGMKLNRWQAAAPLVLDAADPGRLAFPFRFGLSFVADKQEIMKRGPVEGFAHLFNGFLLRADLVSTIGIPDMRLFIRGDEIDFLHRLRSMAVPFGTLTDCFFLHPSSNSEIVPLVRDWLHVVWPNEEVKRRMFFRNRGYNIRTHRLWGTLIRDLLCYGWFFGVKRRGDLEGLRGWFAAMRLGLSGRF